jgi:hypothetical protein
MTKKCRSWWRNCALETDSEILKIDEMEDGLAPLTPDVSRIRELISSFELCHHKAGRWIHNIVEAIGQGQTTKGLGTRPSGQRHPAEEVWQTACNALSAWCKGSPGGLVEVSVGSVPATQLLHGLGERSPLKEWQVQRVIEKIRSVIHWAQADDNPVTKYEWILLGGGEYELAYRNECPACCKDHEDFWLATVRTLIHDTAYGQDAGLSLGLAIDMLWPCHWNFVENLKIVLDAIGGRLSPAKPFAACGRNIHLVPNQERIEAISRTLKAFCGDQQTGKEDPEIIELLGKPTPEKRWLAASLDKTIRLQLHPTAEMRAASALAGPEWIKQ